MYIAAYSGLSKVFDNVADFLKPGRSLLIEVLLYSAVIVFGLFGVFRGHPRGWLR
jgi:hypothetical protein